MIWKRDTYVYEQTNPLCKNNEPYDRMFLPFNQNPENPKILLILIQTKKTLRITATDVGKMTRIPWILLT